MASAESLLPPAPAPTASPSHPSWKPALIVLASIVAVLGLVFLAAPVPHAASVLAGEKPEVKPTDTLSFTFDQPMWHASVQSAFKITPPTAGTFTWSDRTVTFDPANALDKGATYRVTFTENARTWFGKGLAVPFSQAFAVRNDPEVSVVAPKDGVTIRPAQTLTVLFDRPMRVLTGSLDVPKFLKISPDVAGAYHWLGTAGFEFVPTNGWAPATSYAVTLPKGIALADGTSLPDDYAWHFSTPSVSVSLASADGSFLPKSAIRLSFNYPVKAATVQAALAMYEQIVPGAGQPGQATEPALLPASQLTFANDPKDPTAVLIKKRGNFRLGATYRFTLPQGFTGGIGPNGLASEWTQSVVTDELGFRVLGMVCPSNNDAKEVFDSPIFSLNNPADESTFAKGVTVDPALPELQVQSYGWGCNGSNGATPHPLSISGRWKASTKYTVTLGTALTDEVGQHLAAPQTFTFTTKPYQPRADFSGYSQTGVLASHLPRVYQVRTLNLTKPVSTTLNRLSVMDYVRGGGSGGTKIGEKSYDPRTTLNDYKVLDVDLNDVAGKTLPNGFYQLGISIPELGNDYNGSQVRNLVITDTALTVKRDVAGNVVVWATDLVTGDVVANQNVEVYGETNGGWNDKPFATAKTDADGLAKVTGTQGFDNVAVKTGDGTRLGFAFPSWNDGISPWNYNLSLDYRRTLERRIGYLYTDRLIYRPDQTVEFKGVIRKDVDAVLGLPDEKTVDVTFTDPDGNQVGLQTLPVSAFGSFNGSFALTPSMALGTYAFSASFNGESVTGNFDVREFRRPDFEVTATPPAGTVTNGDVVRIPVHAAYYYGAPLANATVNYVVTRRALAFQPMNTDWYSYNELENSYCYWYCQTEGQLENVKSGTFTMNANGDATIVIPASLTDYKSSAAYDVTATVVDVNQRQVSANLEVDVHKGDFYVGIVPDYAKGWGGPTADFKLVTVNPDGTPRGNVAGQVDLFKRTWANVKKDGTNGEPVWDWVKTDTLVDSKPFMTNGKGAGTVSFAPADDGEFVALARTADARGRRIAASVSRWVDRGMGADVRVSDDHSMNIIQNKGQYQVGDTASLVVQVPYDHAKALVSIERETIRDYRVVDLGSNQRTVDVPITDTMTPNVYVSVLAVKGGGAALPEFRLGYANLQVDTSKKVLDLSITPDQPSYHPGDKVSVAVVSKNSDGAPVSAEVSIAVVDERVVALLGSVDKNILGRFWFSRMIGVTTGQTLTQIIKKFFVSTEGGGGGKGDGGAATVRGNFRDTAFWQADVVTDETGHATATFTLPDNLTRWQILAIGATKDTVVGSAEAKVTTRRDLMVESLLPRDVRHGDQLTLGATVFNNTDAAVRADVSLKADGFTVDGPLVKTLALGAQSRLPVYWNVTVPLSAPDQVPVTVEAHAGALADGVASTLPVLGYAVPETVSASNVFGHGASETLRVPDGILPNAGELKVSVTSNVGSGLARSIDYLVRYPYGCAEQTTSALVGGLAYDQLASAKLVTDEKGLGVAAHDAVIAGIKRLVSTRRADGGWGWWPDSDRSNPFLTAYAFWGLTQAQEAGYSVDQNVLDDADQFLRNVLSGPSSCDNKGCGGVPVLSNDDRAQVLYMLARRDPKNLSGYAATAYEQRKKLSVAGKAFLAMALSAVDGNNARAQTVMNEVQSNVVYLDPATAYVTEDAGYDDAFMNSDVRSTSVYLQALLRLDPKNAEIDRVIHWLVRQRADGYWYTTQDTAMSLTGIVEYVKRHPVDATPMNVQVSLDGKNAAQLPFAKGDLSGEQSTSFPLSQLAAGTDHQVGVSKESDTRYFYDLSMKVFREIQNIKPFENGFTVLADAYALSDAKHEHPLSQATQGDTVRVHMKLLVPKDRKEVALEYHLPAGLEAIDFTLNTSPQNIAGQAGQTQQCAPDWSGQQLCMNDWEMGWWWENVWKHIEFRDDRVFLFADTLPAGIYEYDFIAQATTPGTFAVPPARAYEFYDPLANGHNEGKVFKVVAKGQK